MDLYPRIKATWDRKGIAQKMHYSEPTPPAVTPRQRRKHNPRPLTLPPCSPDMDLMIEAKDKEQAVFELMRTFKLPGFDSFNDVVPYVRNDDNKVALAAMNKKKKSADEPEPVLIPDEEVGMGGSEGRVYWPPGMEEWLRPKKREVKKKEPAEAEANSTKSKEQKKKEAAEMYAAREAEKLAENNGGGEDDEDSEEGATPATKKAKAAMKKKEAQQAAKKAAKAQADATKNATKAEATGSGKQNGTKTNGSTKSKPAPPKKTTGRGKKQQPAEEASVPTPSPSEDDATEPELEDDVDEQPISPAVKRQTASSRKPSGRQAKTKKVSYAEDGDESMEDA
ncbi:UV-damage [Hortaea werneckii]|nr:UV-damage [Hortaea werneckii]